MKVFVTFAIVAFVAGAFALTEEQKAKGREVAAKCGENLGVSSEEIQKIKSGDFSNKDEKIQCFAKCFLEEVGFLKEGVLQTDVVIEKLSKNEDKANVEKSVEACKDTQGANDCEKAYNIYKCYHEQKTAVA